MLPCHGIKFIVLAPAHVRGVVVGGLGGREVVTAAARLI